LFIPNPDPDFLPIPDPGVKKALDPGVKKAPDTRIRIRNTDYNYVYDVHTTHWMEILTLNPCEVSSTVYWLSSLVMRLR
jgi:hypothetical protein